MKKQIKKQVKTESLIQGNKFVLDKSLEKPIYTKEVIRKKITKGKNNE